MKIIIDVMGGDNAPDQILAGVDQASREFDAELILVGDKARIQASADAQNIDISGFTVIHTEQVVEMDDEPIVVLHAKKESSMCVGLKMLAAGEGDAFVSAGNTGALFTAASLIVRKLAGIQRAAIAGILPMDPPLLLIDSGANVTVTDKYLEQFAIMGSVYMKGAFSLESPRVGLLNNGTEECKGTEVQIEAYKRLSANENINFVGNVEANQVPFDACDVLVTDGFSGNILLKSIEGMGKLMFATLKNCFSKNIKTKLSYLLVKDQVGDIKKNFDSSTYGGAPILGLRKPVIKAHGSSKARAFKNAIGQAIKYAESTAISEIADEAKRIADAQKQAQNTEKEVEAKDEPSA